MSNLKNCPFTAPQCKPYDLYNSGRAYVLNKSQNDLLCRAQEQRAKGRALTSAEWQALDAYLNHGKQNRSFLDTARACMIADAKEKQIKALENKRFMRRMLVEDIAAGIFASAGIVFILAIGAALIFGKI